MNFKELPNIVVQTIDEIGKQGLIVEKTNQYAAAGYIVFDLLVSQAIFLQITQDDNAYKQVKKAVLTAETDLLKKLIGNIYVDQTIWNLDKYSLAEKVQISYQILGYEYLHGHFDKLYGACVDALLPIFEKNRSNIGNIKPRVFEIGDDDYNGQDQELLNLSNCLNITYTLLFFSLRSRSQLGAQVWQQAGVPLPSFLNPDKLSKQKRLMFNIGQTVVLLTAYEFCYVSGLVDSIDITGLCMSNASVNRNDLLAQLHKVFQTRELATSLFDALALSKPGKLSDNDKRQVFQNVAFSFYVSNFNPGKAFTDVFGKHIAVFYADGFEGTVDHRYAVLSFLGKLGIVADFQGEQNDTTYSASLIIDKKFRFYSTGQFKDDVKKELWKKAFDSTVGSVEKFFCGQPTKCPQTLLHLLVSRISNLSVGMLMSIDKNMWLLNANSMSKIGVDEYARILRTSKNIIDNTTTWDRLMNTLVARNNKYIVCIKSNVYRFSDILAVFDGRSRIEKLQPIQITRTNCMSVYQRIVNPIVAIQKKIVDVDYRVVRYIEPLSFEVAKHAIDNCLDAFNQIALPSQEIKDYYQGLLVAIEEEERNSGELTSFDSKAKIIMFDSNRLLSEQLYELVAPMTLRKAVFACGYCFKSGLSMLNKIISKTVYDGIPVQFVVGSLQKYRACVDGDGTITGIDKSTAQLLNQYLDRDNIQLFTCENRFYHGKIYKFESDTETVICMGSSNISRSAYASNYELNIGFVLPNDSELKHNFDLLIQRVIKSSALIDHLDETVFGDNEINMEGSAVISKLSLSSVQKRINELTNEEVKYRLNLWMSYSPAVAAEDLGIKSLPNYFVFVYPTKKLMVLESFSAGNAYFCIKYSDSFESEINRIANLSKTEIFQYSQMSKRGYHVANKFTLESNIRRYFR